MDAPVTLRLDRETRRKIARIAERRRISKSEVVRQALRSWPEFRDNDKSPYELIADLVGSVNGGDPKRSENSARKVKEILKQKRRQR
jgi:Arc/MetJ-type ribon-helix-helix transcriptional regulator